MKTTKFLLLLFMVLALLGFSGYEDSASHMTGRVSFKSPEGRLYAYIVLLFNENPHFVNLLQKGTIPHQEIGNEGFHVKEYRRYLSSYQTQPIAGTASLMFDVYLQPNKYSDDDLNRIEKNLESQHIVLRFSRKRVIEKKPITLDYCIFARKEKIIIRHPFLEQEEELFNIQPHIYYDEFSTSNSTFYYNMIYINPDEVLNDVIIAQKILMNHDVSNFFFVGSPINDNIRYCIRRAFSGTRSIHQDIWKMFVIHEITHKTINNTYNHYDQVTGEELALSSTIYANPYLGLSVLYSYLNYNAINPHRIAANNYISYLAEESKNKLINEDPSLIKLIPEADLKSYTKSHFAQLLEKVRQTPNRQ